MNASLLRSKTSDYEEKEMMVEVFFGANQKDESEIHLRERVLIHSNSFGLILQEIFLRISVVRPNEN